MKNIISLSKFLAIYYGFEGAGLKTITHKDVKRHFPGIESCDRMFDLDTLQLEEKIVYVDDGKSILPYFTKPTQHDEYCPYCENDIKKTNNNKNDKNITDMNNYELICMLNIRFNRRSESRKARKELNERGISLKRNYKIKRDKDIILSKIKEEE